MSAHLGRQRRDDLKQVLRHIVGLARREQADLLLVAGDLFEQRCASKGTIKYIDDLFRSIPDVRVFIAPGNHDPLVEGSYYFTYNWAPNVHIFGPRWEAVDLPDLGCTVHGLGFDAWEIDRWRPAAERARDPERVNIAVIHGSDLGSVPGESAPYHPFTARDLANLGMDYVALGHYHRPSTVSEGGRLLGRYPGSPEPLSFGEPGQHGVLLGYVGKQGARLETVPTSLREYITLEADCCGCVSTEDVMAVISELDGQRQRGENLYRVTLTGTVDQQLHIDCTYLSERLQREFYLLRLIDQTQPDYDLERLAEEHSARGLFVQRLLQRELDCREPSERELVRRALYLGLAAFEGRRAIR